MRTTFKILIPVIAIVGFVLSLFPNLKNIGLIVLMTLIPIFLSYAILLIKQDFNDNQVKYRRPFLIISTMTTIIIVLTVLFKIQHYPGAGIGKIISGMLAITALTFGLIYLIRNKNSFSQIHTYELILMIFPSIIFTWQLVPGNIPPQLNREYVKLISISNRTLDEQNHILLKASDQQDTFYRLEEIKLELVNKSGGYDQTNTQLKRFHSSSALIILKKHEPFIKSLDTSQELISLLLNSKIVGDAMFIISQIQHDLLIKKAHNTMFHE